jgi:Tetratricopeptide repeat
VLAGREGLLTDLHLLLTGGNKPWPRAAVLCGLGGVGKTSVAMEYAHRQLAEIGVTWQLAAEDPALLTSGFRDLAAQMGALDIADARDPVKAAHAALAGYPADWLLVFDNAPDEVTIRSFLPPAGRGRVLITSQATNWPAGQIVDVPVLDLETSTKFLVSRTDDRDQKAAAELAGLLGGLPLALEQAAAYIRATAGTLTRYLELFRERRADLLARGEVAGHPATVAATLGLAYSRLEAEAPTAAGLLRLTAFLAPEPVPLTLLLSSPRPSDVVDRHSGDAAVILGPLRGDPVAIGDAVAALRRYSLITPAGAHRVLVHRLVQAVIADQMPAELAASWRHFAAVLVMAAIPADTRLPQTWSTCAALLPHARAALSLTSDGMWRIAQYLGHSGSYQTSRELYRSIAGAHGEAASYGPEHRDTLGARHLLARWTGEAGDAVAARDQFAVLLTDMHRILGPDDHDTLITRNQLAYYTGEAGDSAGARDQLEEVLPEMERILGLNHPDTLLARHNLAYYTGLAGDPAATRDRLAALLRDAERILGRKHPDTLAARHNLAYYTGLAGDPAAARDRLAALLRDAERILGRKHPDTLAARHDLATWTGEAGDPATARDQLAALLPDRERILGASHPDTVSTRSELGRWTEKADRAEA